jgi:hypothetical protein
MPTEAAGSVPAPMPPAGFAQRSVDPRHVVVVVLAAAALVLVASHGTWRLALLTAAAAAAVMFTRTRYALPLALVLLAVVAVLAVTDRTAGGDERSSRAPSGGASQYAGINVARWLRAPAPFARTLVRLWVMR